MSDKVLDFLGQTIMHKVRDVTISNIDMIINGKMKGDEAKAIREMLVDFNPKQIEILKRIIPRIVDRTLHNFLWMIEQEDDIDLLINSESGFLSAKELSDGLTGELYSDEGWIAKFSKERYEEY